MSQDQASIERYVRQGDVWILTETVGLEASMPLVSIDCILSLREVYDKVLDDGLMIGPRAEAQQFTKRGPDALMQDLIII